MFNPFKFLARKPSAALSKEEILASWPELKDKRLSKAKAKLSKYKEKASSVIQELENQAVTLQNTNIKSRDIGGQVISCPSCTIPGLPSSPDRIISIAEGNKERYVPLLFNFISWLKSWQEKLDEPDLQLFTEFETQLNNFWEKTKKNFAVLSETIGQKVSVVLESLGKLNQLNGKIKAEIGKSKLAEILQIDSDLADVKKLKDKIISLNNRDKSLSIDAKKTEKELEDWKKDLERTKISKEVEDLNLNRKEQEKAGLEVKNKEEKIRSFFNQYQKALKKYLHANPICKVNYLEDPILGLEEDRELKIIDVFVNLKKEIDSTDLTEKQRNEVRNLEPERIRELKQNLVDARRKRIALREKEKALLSSGILSQMREKETLLKNKQNELYQIRAEREELVKQVSNLRERLELLENEVEAKISSLL